MSPLDDIPGIYPAHAEGPLAGERAVTVQPVRTRRAWNAVFLVAAAIGLYLLVSSTNRAPEGWGGDFNHAMAEARATGKKVVVDFYLEGCPPCIEMDRKVLGTAAVRKALADFVPVRLDGERHVQVARQYEVLATPTYLVLDPDGKMIARAEGYLPVEEFISFLKSASKPPQEQPAPMPQADGS